MGKIAVGVALGMSLHSIIVFVILDVYKFVVLEI